MRKIKETKQPRRTVLRLSDSDWREILDGGSFELEKGRDFDGKVSTAADHLRRELRERLGYFKIRELDENSGFVIEVIGAKK